MMERFRKILVGIDLTPEGDAVSLGSRRAALQAQWLAERTGASLTFFHSTWFDMVEAHQILYQAPSPEGAEALQELANDYEETGIPCELVTSKERPWIEMVRRVLRGENDLVVVARRNDAGSALAFGSVSRKLVHNSPAPVWVVKPDSELVHRRVLAATDLTPVGDLAVDLGAYVAKAYGCELHVIHAWQVSLEMQMSAEIVGEEEHRARLRGIQEAAETHVREALAARAPDVEPHLHIGRDAPSRAILAGVERLEPDLLVMGSVSRGGIAGFLVGNTAEKLLDRVPCSLLAIKPVDFVASISAS